MLKISILIFQPCVNVAGYICVEVASPVLEEPCTYKKSICLTHSEVYFDMLVVLDSKEIEFNKRILEVQCHCTKSANTAIIDMKVRIFFSYYDQF